MKLTKKALKLTRVTGTNSIPTHEETRPVLIDIYKTLVRSHKNIEIILLTREDATVKSFSEIKDFFKTNQNRIYNNLLEQIEKVKDNEFLGMIVVTVKIPNYESYECIGLSIIEKPTKYTPVHEPHTKFII